MYRRYLRGKLDIICPEPIYVCQEVSTLLIRGLLTYMHYTTCLNPNSLTKRVLTSTFPFWQRLDILNAIPICCLFLITLLDFVLYMVNRMSMQSPFTKPPWLLSAHQNACFHPRHLSRHCSATRRSSCWLGWAQGLGQSFRLQPSMQQCISRV